MDVPSVTLRLPASKTAPRAARRGVVDGLALEGELAVSTALLVSEAVTNSVLHASLAPDDLVHVDASRTEGRVRVEVCDEGIGLYAPSPAGPRDGGHGLKIIDRLAERWGLYSDGRTRIWFELAG
ncbi:MAG: ATP-binding protein [Actinomycetota bacterium]|nr:ATP-binding protein [Actinomycetota bacterium]